MPHLVLLGDSIFDNGAYVPGQPAVIDQVRAALGSGWNATLLAVDGDVTADVVRQVKGLPRDATHLAVSAGGNDALGQSFVLGLPAQSVGQAVEVLAAIQADFRARYRDMFSALTARRLPTIVCTIYDAIPGLDRGAAAALTLFNDVILRESIAAGFPVLDLRLLCSETSDYSALSPIEPSHRGGQKIAQALARIARSHDFRSPHAVIYSRV